MATMLTLTQKIILAYTLVFGLALGGFAVVVYHNTRVAEVKKLDAIIDSRMEKAQDEIEELRTEGRFPGTDLDSALLSVDLKNARIRILDRAGTFVAGDTSLRGLSAPEINRVIGGNWFHGMYTLKDQQYRSVWAPMDIDDHIQFAAQVLVPMHGIEDLLRRQLLLFACLIPALLVFTGLAAYFITKKTLNPIHSMVETAHSISAGTLDRRLPVPRPNDEIRTLALSLNTMMERIHAAFDVQRRFVADAAHAIRTPLTIINGELEFAENEASGELKKSVSAAREESGHLARLGEQLLALARLDAVAAGATTAFRRVRLDELLVDCVQRMSSFAAEKHIDLKVCINEAIELWGDADRLREMVRNLIDNAIKYSPSGSSVQVQLARKNADVAVIAVSDNGPGIGDEDLPHIFKRFYRSETFRSRESGSGLGLSIVEQVARLHQGKVRVESTPGKGSTFTIELPLNQPETPPPVTAKKD